MEWKEKKLDIQFSAGVKYKGLFFLSALHMNALFVYDEKKEKLLFLTSFKKEKKRDYLYVKTFLYNSEAWFIPYCADNIAIVNLDKLTIEYIPVCQKKDAEKIKYINYLNFKEDFLCLIPQEIDAMMIINLKSKKTKTYTNFLEREKFYLYHGAIFLDEKIYFFPWRGKEVLEFNLETEKHTLLPWAEDQEAFGDVVHDKKSGQLFCAPARENYIPVYDLQKKLYKKIKFEGCNERKIKTYYSTVCDREVFFWGHEKNIVIRVNEDNTSVKIYKISHNSTGEYFFPISAESVEALVFGGNCIIRYDMENDVFVNIYFSTTVNNLLREIEESDVNFWNVVGCEEGILRENTLLDFRQIIPFIWRDRKKEFSHKGDIGNAIYRSICRNY